MYVCMYVCVNSSAPSVFIILLACPERSQIFSVAVQPDPSLPLPGRITFSSDLNATPEVGAYSAVMSGDRPSCSARYDGSIVARF